MALDYAIAFTLKEASYTSVVLTGRKESATVAGSANVTFTSGSETKTFPVYMGTVQTEDFTFDGLTAGKTYTITYSGDVVSGSVSSVTTLDDNPKVATESMWADLINKVKSLDARVTALES